VHLSPLDGEIALSHKLSDFRVRALLVTSNLSELLPTALKFWRRACSTADRLRVTIIGASRHAASAAAEPSAITHAQFVAAPTRRRDGFHRHR